MSATCFFNRSEWRPGSPKCPLGLPSTPSHTPGCPAWDAARSVCIHVRICELPTSLAHHASLIECCVYCQWCYQQQKDKSAIMNSTTTSHLGHNHSSRNHSSKWTIHTCNLLPFHYYLQSTTPLFCVVYIPFILHIRCLPSHPPHRPAAWPITGHHACRPLP